MNWSVFQNRNILSASSRFKYFSVHYLPIYSVKLAFIIANVSYIYVCVYIYIYRLSWLLSKWKMRHRRIKFDPWVCKIPGEGNGYHSSITVHGVLKARILKRFAVAFSSGPCYVRTPHHNPSVLLVIHGIVHSFIELDKAVFHVIRLVSVLWLWFSFCLASDG